MPACSTWRWPWSSSLVGVKKVMRFLPPVVTGPIIVCIGLTLAPSAVSNASTCWPLALIALATIIIFNIWGKGMFKIIPILLGVVVSYIAALIMNACGVTVLNAAGEAIPLIDFTAVREASILGLPPFQMAKFDLTAILVMAPIALATMMEHIGDMSAISATVGQNFIQEPGLHRTLVGDGIATSLAGMFGGPANTTYGENTGVLVLSKVHDPRVIRLAAVYAIVLSFIPKMADIIGSMPSAIVGGVSFILYGMISAIGVRNIVENNVDLTKSRNLIIAAVILVCGLGFSSGITFTVAGTSITLTGLAIAAIGGHPAQRHPPRQRLRVRRQSRGRPEPRYPSVSWRRPFPLSADAALFHERAASFFVGFPPLRRILR